MTGTGLPYWRLSGFYFFYFALAGVLLPYWSLYLQWLHFDAWQIGLVAAVMMVTRVLAPNIWGWLADQYGRRLGLVRTGSLLALFSFSLLFWRQDFGWLLLATALFSFFWNAVLAQFEVLTLAWLFPHTGRYSLIRQWGSVGFVVAVLGLGFGLAWLGLQAVPWLVLVLLLAIWLVTLWAVEAPESTSRPQGPGFVACLRRVEVWRFLAIAFLLQVGHGPYYTFYSIHLQTLGFSEGAIGLLWTLGVSAEIGIFWIMHRLLARWSLRQLLVVGLGLTALRWCLIAVLDGSATGLALAQLLHAASFGLTHAVAIEWIRQAFPGRAAGQGQALYTAVGFGAGGAVGALLAGMFWAWSASGTFWLASLCTLVATALAWRLKLTSE